MKKCSTDRVRNFVLAGQTGAGKTSLADLILFKGGAVSRQGSVDAGTSVSEFRKEEQDRKSSIYSAILNTPWKDGHLFFVDTPGSTDFCGDALNAINATDLHVLVVDAAQSNSPGTIRAWRMARDLHLPRVVFINGCDREEADFERTIEQLKETCIKKASVAVSLPIGQKAKMTGVASLLSGDISALGPEAEENHNALIECIAESDDALTEKYFEEGTLSDEDVLHGLRKALLNESIIPIFAGSVAKGLGVEELLDFILQYGPTPTDNVPVKLTSGSIDRASDAAVGYVFKSVNDTFIGQLTYIRILSGTFKKDMELTNTSNQGKERLGGLLCIQGKNQENIEEAGPGEIVAVAKLKNTGMLEVLSTGATDIVYAPVEYPQPTTQFSISAVNKGEDDKLAAALARLLAEDKTLKKELNMETHQTIVCGMGDQQINLVVNRMKNDFKVQVALEAPRIAYRETVKGIGQADFRHKKQSGGHGQFAEVHMRLEPFQGETPEEEYQFGNEVVGGAIPKNFIPAIEKGVAETRLSGPLSHSKCINFKAVVFFGKYHPVDSSEMAFKIATRGAFRAAMANAKPELLEPIMNMTLEFPEEYMGTIQGDLNTRRGRILGMDRVDGQQVLSAEMPLAEIYPPSPATPYPTQLRSMTQGRGSFSMKFDRYDPVPSAIAKKIQEAAAKEEEDEE
ncbi:MAG: elongation factor G [Lentisphaeria bacterium]|nr:elongation factor G [Lentisphaeria bacterium]